MFEQILSTISGEELISVLLRAVLVVLILILTWVGQRVARWLVVRLVEGLVFAITRARQFDVKWEAALSHDLARPIQIMVDVIGLRLAFALIDLSAEVALAVNRLTASIVTMSLFWLLYRIVNVITPYYVAKAAQETSPLDETVVRFARQIGNILIIIFAVVFVLQQWGQDVGALVAGLGIASLAVALAAQDALSNIIAYLAIVADSPFKVGDFIIINDLVKGRVQDISFRSTRIRTIDNSIMIIPNNTIANANVINWARTRKRRLDMVIGLTYSSTPEQIQEVISDSTTMLDDHDHVTNDRIVVEFVEFGESSLNLRLSFMVKSSTWEDLEAVKTDINLKLMRIFEKHGVSVAFPTRTVYLEPNAAT
ncbi:MAG: mechanosensitive ion channel [Anaerolineaceae bacterium]|nr:mechanosensitive ion channel [Anaerolineaceae bacterium]